MAFTSQDLQRQHPEAAAKANWFTFCLDAWEGSGGFAPNATPEDRTALGSVISTADHVTYVWQHDRESAELHARRAAHARYQNRLRYTLGHWIGLLLRRPPERTGLTAELPEVQRFLADCDGAGTPWDDALRQWITRAILFAGCPLLVDRAESASPYIRHVLPGALYDWQRDGFSRWEWVKIVEQLSLADGPTDERVDAYRAQIWTPEEVVTYSRVGNDEPIADPDLTSRHGLGVVPLAWLAYDDSMSGELWGWTPAAVLALIGREEINDHSRLLDIHERQTFSQLCVPVAEGAEGKDLSFNTGTTAAFTYSQGGSAPTYLAPPDGPVAAHERKLDRDRTDTLQALGLEMLLSSTQAPTSGVARQYEFAHLNAALRRFAYRAERAERDVIRLVLRWHDYDDAKIEKALDAYAVQWPDDFDVRDRTTELDLAERLLVLPGIDPVTQRAVVRSVRKTLVQMDATELAAADEWATESAKAAEEAAKLAGPSTTSVTLAPTDQAAVVTVNEARSSQGLGPLRLASGDVDPRGFLTVEQFRSLTAPAPQPFGGGATATDEDSEEPDSDEEPAEDVADGGAKE